MGRQRPDVGSSRDAYAVTVMPSDRRSVLLERLADFILAEGLGAASIRPLAASADLSDRMLLYYFDDKADVIAATLDTIAARLAVLLRQQTAVVPLPLDRLAPALADCLSTDLMWPYMRLWLEIASRAARNDPIYRPVGERIARGFLAWGAAQLDSAPADRAADSATLLVLIEGRVVLKSVGLDDIGRLAR